VVLAVLKKCHCPRPRSVVHETNINMCNVPKTDCNTLHDMKQNRKLVKQKNYDENTIKKNPNGKNNVFVYINMTKK